jgi:hypothetical protein
VAGGAQGAGRRADSRPDPTRPDRGTQGAGPTPDPTRPDPTRPDRGTQGAGPTPDPTVARRQQHCGKKDAGAQGAGPGPGAQGSRHCGAQATGPWPAGHSSGAQDPDIMTANLGPEIFPHLEKRLKPLSGDLGPWSLREVQSR